MPLLKHPLQGLLSGGDALSLLEVINGSLLCSTKEQYHELFQKLEAILPMEQVFSGVAKLEGSGSILSYTMENISYREDWLKLYFQKGFIDSDVIINENFKTYAPQYWRETYAKSPPLPEFRSLAEDFGLKNGYSHGSMPFGKWTHASLFSFSSPEMKKKDDRIMAILATVVPHMHQALSSYLHSAELSKFSCKISPRELEIIRWMKEGKSSWDMANILKISERTVNFTSITSCRNLMP
jgi:hypothetical protein